MQLLLNKRIYPKEIVEEAVEAYTEVATISLKSKGRYHVVEIDTQEEEYRSVIAGEFANYCLALVAESRGTDGKEEG